jgi:hypothetical protein
MFDFFDWLFNWLSTGLWSIVQEAIVWLVTKIAIWKFESMLWALDFSWGIGRSVVESLSLSQHIQQAFGSVDTKVLNNMTFFRVPEALNIILSAVVSKFVLRFIPFV